MSVDCSYSGDADSDERVVGFDHFYGVGNACLQLVDTIEDG